MRGVAEWEVVIEERVRGLFADGDQVFDGDLIEGLFGLRLIEQVAADETGVGLGNFDEHFAGAVVGSADDVDALVGLAFAEDWEVEHYFSVIPRGGGRGECC